MSEYTCPCGQHYTIGRVRCACGRLVGEHCPDCERLVNVIEEQIEWLEASIEEHNEVCKCNDTEKEYGLCASISCDHALIGLRVALAKHREANDKSG